ncbi:hypothetical protein TEA_001147 [Camellia sinensis var. sinensis]|uniref:Alkyl transferase n=1 Tax=Camellia sinensis var. sinensis TaxID=542762 RepID=A0A4S4DYD5_CAMSN|nr:hypothetical protein TEA_001147 [Camellia sinensis var. sinensis]
MEALTNDHSLASSSITSISKSQLSSALTTSHKTLLALVMLSLPLFTFPPITLSHHPSKPLSPTLLLRRRHHQLCFRPSPDLSSACATAQSVIVEEEEDVGAGEEETLPAGLRRDLMPDHVAVIMDGNRRWARMRGLPSGSGYEAGVRALRVLVKLCCRWGIRVLTVFAFSSDNWFRPKVEVDFLMNLLERGMNDELDNFLRIVLNLNHLEWSGIMTTKPNNSRGPSKKAKNRQAIDDFDHLFRENIRISSIGDSSKLPDPIQGLITDAEERTKHNSGLQLIVAVSYSGKYDIVQACQSISLKVKDSLIEPEDINEFLIEQELQTKCTEIPDPDLLIRTSGELRVSNFFLWQLAYTELYFTQSHWPDFGEIEFVEALQSFQQRHRRYGKRDS